MERRYEDLMLHVRVRRADDAAVDYEVRELVFVDDGEGEPLKFACTDENGSSNVTLDINRADVMIRGWVKFDGCSHNNFGDPDNRGYYHGCQREHLTRLGPLYDRLYDWVIELIGHEEFLRPSPL